MPDLNLQIGGYEMPGWSSVQVQRSLDQLADSFDFAVSSPLSSAPPVIPIREGDEVVLTYDGELIVSGYLDDVDESSNVSSFTLRVSGRSKAKDLIDCSAIHKGAWRAMKLDAIAQDLAVPFGLKLTSDLVDLPIEKVFRLQDSETAWEAIDRLVRDHGMRVVSNPDGSLLLTRTGLLRFPDVVLERGVNIVEGGIKRSESDRFSQYIFKATAAATDETYGEDAVAEYAITDDGVDRYRPLVVHREGKANNLKGALKTAAEWERNTRAGKSQQLSYRILMPGAVERSWEMPGDHGIWSPNIIVGVRDKNHAVNGEFLVTSVTLRRSSAGTETQLELTHPEAYQPQKPPKKKPKGGGISW